MPAEIDESIQTSGEEVVIVRGDKRIYEKQFLKTNRQVSKEEHLFNSIKGLFTSDTKCIMGDIVELPGRAYVNKYYFVESREEFLAEDEMQLLFVTLKRMNCHIRVVTELPVAEKDFFNIKDFSYQSKIKYGDPIPGFVMNPLQSEDDGFNMSVDTDSVYIRAHITSGLKRNNIIRVLPISDFEIPEDIAQFYRIRHINSADFPNMMHIKARNESMSVTEETNGS